MADKTFLDFDSKTELLSSDYLVGYDSTIPKEIKIPYNYLTSAFVKSDTSFTPGASSVNNIVMINMTNFLALTSRDPYTAYLIVDESLQII